MGSKKRRRSSKHMLIPDPLLLSRLNKYLESKRNEETIDQNRMVEDLRSQYKEYEKRDKVSFRASVFRAYNYIVEPLINPTNRRSEGGGESSLEEEDGMTSSDEVDDVVVEEVIDSSTPKNNPKEKNNGILSYMQTVQRMVNSSNKEKSPDNGVSSVTESRSPILDAIDISSDDEEVSQGQKKESQANPVRRPVPSRPPLLRTSQPAPQRAPTIPKIPPNISINPVSVSLVRTQVEQTTIKRKAPPLFAQDAKRKREISFKVPVVNFTNFGGNPKILEMVRQLLHHMTHPEVYHRLGVSPPRGFLLHGPPGTGKTLLAHCIAGELEIPMVKVCAPELIAGVSGESEQRIRDLFEEASRLTPCLLFIDEIDVISGPRQSASKDMERRIVSQLISSFDELSEREECDQVIVVGATNRLESIDTGLRRAGRFDKELSLGMPDTEARLNILTLLTSKLKLSSTVDLNKLASATPGYVGADLKALASQAAIKAINRHMKSIEKSCDTLEENKVKEKEKKDEETSEGKDVQKKDKESENESKEGDSKSDKEVVIIPSESICISEIDSLTEKQLEEMFIEEQDFLEALKDIQPSAKREGFATVPDVSWDDIGSLKDVRDHLHLSIMMPVKYPKECETLGLSTTGGVMLCGPPGCGKTLLAKAVANEANINFISVKGPELLNMYLGESERAVRQCFHRARTSQPCVIFFDEIDALCPKRSDSSDGRAGSRVVNQLLTEMDGVEGGRSGVFLMAATNRPDMVDPAVLRPGRFDKVLYVGLPSPADRVDILKAITKEGKKTPLNEDVDLEAIGKSNACNGFTGADLAALVKEASIEALSAFVKSDSQSPLQVKNQHIQVALKKIRPSVSEKDQKRYEQYRLLYTPSGSSESCERMDEGE